MTVTLALQISTIIALIAILAFIVNYSRYRFEDTPEGINQMVTAGAVCLLAVGYIIARMLDFEAALWIIVAGWLTVAGVFIWRIKRQEDLHKEDKIKKTKEH